MRKNTRKVDLIIIAVILLFVSGGVLRALLPKNGSNNSTAESENASGGTKTASDYNGRQLGIMTGSSFEKPTLEMFPLFPQTKDP